MGTFVIIVISAAALRLLIAEPAPDLVTGAVEEAPFVRIIIIRRAPVARPAISRSRPAELAARAISIAAIVPPVAPRTVTVGIPVPVRPVKIPVTRSEERRGGKEVGSTCRSRR